MTDPFPRQAALTATLLRRQFFVGLLTMVLFGALEITEWLVLVTDAPVPWLDKNLPYVAPFVVVILIFNMWLAARSGNGRITVSLEPPLFILFIVAIFAIELSHLFGGGGEMQTWLHLGYFWMVVFFLTLCSLHPLLPRCREWVIALTITLTAFLVALYLLVVTISPAWGVAFPGFNASQLFDSPYVAYTALFALALVLFEYSPGSRRSGLAIYFLGAPILLGGIFLQRLTGPVLLLLALLVLKAISLARGNGLRAILGLLAVLAVVSILRGLTISGDPTLTGLLGGTYFFDEIGVIHGDIASSYVRRETLLESLRLFRDAPLFGIGMGGASEVKSLIFGLHSNAMYLLLATGMAGFALFALPVCLASRHAYMARGSSALALPLLVLGVMLLMPKVMWWWAVALYLISSNRVGERAEIGIVRSGGIHVE